MECVVNFKRGTLVESSHKVHCAVVSITGEMLESFGEYQKLTSWRSAAKPFQVLPFIRHNGIARYKINEAELAIMAASHNGEPVHIKLVRDILKKMDIAESELACGAAAPLNSRIAREMDRRGEVFAAIHNNCSGKHTCMHWGWPDFLR